MLFFCVQEGKDYLLKSVGMWLPALKQRAASSSAGEDIQVGCSCGLVFVSLPPAPVRSWFIYKAPLTNKIFTACYALCANIRTAVQIKNKRVRDKEGMIEDERWSTDFTNLYVFVLECTERKQIINSTPGRVLKYKQAKYNVEIDKGKMAIMSKLDGL